MLEFDKGNLSKIIRYNAGDSILEECKRNYPSGIDFGNIAITGSGKLQKNSVRKIFHCALPEFNKITFVTVRYSVSFEKVTDILCSSYVVSVAKWLESLILKSHDLHCCRFKSHHGLWILSCEEAIHLTYGMLVVLLSLCLKKCT